MADHTPRSISERGVFVDTSAFLALVDRNDRYHEQARRALQRLQTGRYRLLTTKYVIVEAHAGILSAVNSDAGRAFLGSMLRSVTRLLPIEDADEDHAEAILFRYVDKDYLFCDAISFAIMERSGVRLAFAFDDHFRQHGFSTPLGQQEWP